MNKIIQLLSILVIAFTALPHTAQAAQRTTSSKEGKGILQPGGGALTMAMSIAPRPMSAASRTVIWDLSTPFPAPTEQMLAAAARPSPLEEMFAPTASEQPAAASAAATSVLELSSSTRPPWIRRLPTATWEASLVFMRDRRAAQLEKFTKMIDQVRATAREKRERTNKRRQDFLRRKMQEWLARNTAQAGADLIDQDTKRERAAESRPAAAAHSSFSSNIPVAPDVTAGSVRAQCESIRVALRKALDQIPLEENHFINEIREGIEDIIGVYLPRLISNPTLQISATVAQSINYLATNLPEPDDHDPITDEEMLGDVGSHITMLANDYRNRFVLPEAAAAAAATATSASSSSTHPAALVTVSSLQSQCESIRVRLARVLGQIAPQEDHFINELRPGLEEIVSIYLPHLISNPTLHISAAVADAIRYLAAHLPAADNTTPITDDQILGPIGSHLAMLSDDFSRIF